MKKVFLIFSLLFLAIAVFATPQMSGKAEYIVRYINGRFVQEIRDVNSSTLNIGGNFIGKVSFSIYESNTIADVFSKYVHSPIISQTSMAKLVFNEFYIQYDGENIELTVGKYYTGWGTSPLLNPIDLLSPYDFTNAFDSPVKLPIMGVRGIYYMDNSQIELDLIPEFSPDLFQTLPATFENVPSKPQNAQLGVRYETTLENYNLSLDAYHGFSHAYVPVNDVLKHPVLNGIGWEFSGPFPLNKNYGFYGETMYLLSNGISNVTGLVGINGFGNDYSWALEYSRGLPGQSPFDLENTLILYGTKNFANESSLKTAVFLGKVHDSYGALVNLEIGFQPVQSLNIALGFNFSKGLKGVDYFRTNEKENSFYIKGSAYF